MPPALPPGSPPTGTACSEDDSDATQNRFAGNRLTKARTDRLDDAADIIIVVPDRDGKP